MDSSPMNKLSHDTLHQIFSFLPLPHIIICRSVCKYLYHLLTSPSFIHLISSKPPLRFLALRPPHHHHRHHRYTSPPPPPLCLHVYEAHQHQWLKFDISFLPFRSLHPVASSSGLVYLWADSLTSPADQSTGTDTGNGNGNGKSLLVCNPLTRQCKVLPQLGSAWSRHGSVLVDSVNRVMVLTELAALYFSSTANKNSWLTFSANLPSKPRSPVLVWESAFALCDVGSPWRPQWKLFTCKMDPNTPNTHHQWQWACLEKLEWGEIFDIIKRPRLVRGTGRKLLMVGGLKSTFSLNPACSTILILRLDLERLEWEEAGRMPVDIYKCFQDSSKLKVFGGGDRVCFSAKRVGKLAMWEDGFEGDDAVWRWIDGVPGGGDGLCRGFVFEASLTTLS